MSMFDICKENIFKPFSTKKNFKIGNKNEIIDVSPEKIHFCYAKLDSYHKIITIHNLTDKTIVIRLEGTLNEYFIVDYDNRGWIKPGSFLLATVFFIPKELRNYKDFLKIHCEGQGNGNLMVPIEAFIRSKDDLHIPTIISFGTVPLGEKAVYELELKPKKVDYVFFVVSPNMDSDVTLYPQLGKVKTNVPNKIIIEYIPTRYVTISFEINLFFPELIWSAFSIRIDGECKPGMIRDKILENLKPLPKIVKKNFFCKKFKIEKPSEEFLPQILEKSNNQICTMHELNQILMKKDLSDVEHYELIGVLGKYNEEITELYNTKKEKFLKKVEEFKKANSEYHIMRPKITYEIVNEIITRITSEQLAERNEFQSLLECKFKDIFINKQTKYYRQKSSRNYKEVIDTSFYCPHNNIWFFRFQILCKFVQAVRKIIIRNRLIKRLNTLKRKSAQMLPKIETKLSQSMIDLLNNCDR